MYIKDFFKTVSFLDNLTVIIFNFFSTCLTSQFSFHTDRVTLKLYSFFMLIEKVFPVSVMSELHLTDIVQTLISVLIKLNCWQLDFIPIFGCRSYICQIMCKTLLFLNYQLYY